MKDNITSNFCNKIKKFKITNLFQEDMPDELPEDPEAAAWQLPTYSPKDPPDNFSIVDSPLVKDLIVFEEQKRPSIEFPDFIDDVPSCFGYKQKGISDTIIDLILSGNTDTSSMTRSN